MKVAYKGAVAVQMSIFDMLDLDDLPVAPKLSQMPAHSERVLQAEPKENFDYTVEHVFIAHQVVLEDALALLTRKGSLRAKIDIIAWIFGRSYRWKARRYQGLYVPGLLHLRSRPPGCDGKR